MALNSCGEHVKFEHTCDACNVKHDAWIDEQKKDNDKRERHERYEHIMHRADIPARFKTRSFDGFKTNHPKQERALKIATRYAEHFDERLAQGGGLVFCGLPGTGKTHLACAIANHIARDGYQPVYSTLMMTIWKIRSSYRPNSQETEVDALKKFIKPHLLVLDEVGVQLKTEHEWLLMTELLNQRYAEMRPTILISNLNEQEVLKTVGDRIMDRMCEGGGAVVAFDWESYRRTNA